MRKHTPSRTAEIVALQRAMDQRNPAEKRIVDDPWARHFLTRPAKAALSAVEKSGRLGHLLERYSVGLTAYVQTRHRYIDDRLVEALEREQDPVEQVVVLGAGYDMRAHRMGGLLRGRPIFEVDHPATAKRKAHILDELRAAGDLEADGAIPVTVDFQTQGLAERLAECGFVPGRRTFFIWEGVVMYLPRAAVQATLRTLRELGAPGSELVQDCWFLIDSPDLRAVAHRLSADLLHVLGEPMLFSLHPEDSRPFFEQQGWQVVEMVDAAGLEKRYIQDGRQVYPACYMVLARSTGA